MFLKYASKYSTFYSKFRASVVVRLSIRQRGKGLLHFQSAATVAVDIPSVDKSIKKAFASSSVAPSPSAFVSLDTIKPFLLSKLFARKPNHSTRPHQIISLTILFFFYLKIVHQSTIFTKHSTSPNQSINTSRYPILIDKSFKK